MSNLYAQAGVNIQDGDDFSEIVGKFCKSTYGNNAYVAVHDLAKGNFRGPSPFSFQEGRGFFYDAGPDGVGTKVGLHDALMAHHGAARDLLAMTAGDITRYGGKPILFWNILNVASLGNKGSERFNVFVRAVQELVAAGNEIGAVIHKGETAEKGVFVGTDNPSAFAPFDWEGVAFGVGHPDKLIYGDKVRPGDVVVALREYGFRSNGISLVRKAFERRYGPNFTDVDAQADLKLAAVPSVLYDRMLTIANGWEEDDLTTIFDVRLIAHLTGGGFGKFVELLKPTGLSAVLHNLYDPPEIMQKCARWMEVPDEEFYCTWNGGQGKLVVLPPDQAADFMLFARQYGIESQVCGDIAPSDSTSVVVMSKTESGEKVIFT